MSPTMTAPSVLCHPVACPLQTTSFSNYTTSVSTYPLRPGCQPHDALFTSATGASSPGRQPRAPLLDAFTGATAHKQSLDARVDRVQVAQKLCQVEVQVRQQVHLIY